jgi:hypothetical protein
MAFALGFFLLLREGPQMGRIPLVPAGVELAAAVRLFQKLVPPEMINSHRPPTSSTVYTPWIVAWLMVYQRLSGYVSMAAAVGELACLDGGVLPVNKRTRERMLSANTGGYAQARDRIRPASVQSASDEVTKALAAHAPPSLGDRRVLIVDGSTLSLAATDELHEAFPPARNQHGASHWPILRLVTAHELSSGAAFRPELGRMYGDNAVGEVELSAGLLKRLPERSVLLADRNFGVFGFAWQAWQSGHDFVLRLTEERFRPLMRAAERVGEGEWELVWRPSVSNRRSDPELPADARVFVHLKEIRVPNGPTLWLASSVNESNETLAELYRRRQHIETDLRDLKRTMRMEELRGGTVDLVLKEIAAATIAYNLVVLIRGLAAERVRVEPRRLSFSRVWALVKRLLLESFAASDPARAEERIEMTLRMAGQCKLPNRPGRNYPREVIPRRRKFPERKRPPNDDRGK